jgi:hypothetical protein
MRPPLRRVWSQQISGNWRLPYLEAAAVLSQRVPWRSHVSVRARSLYISFTALRCDALFAATSPTYGAAPLRRPEYSVRARLSGSPMQPAHANSPFSDAIAFPPVSQRRSVRSSISMTSISILSPRPTRHRAFNAWHGAPAAPARALPLDTANVPSRVAVNSSSPAHIFVHRGRDVRVSACKAYPP